MLGNSEYLPLPSANFFVKIEIRRLTEFSELENCDKVFRRTEDKIYFVLKSFLGHGSLQRGEVSWLAELHRTDHLLNHRPVAQRHHPAVQCDGIFVVAKATQAFTAICKLVRESVTHFVSHNPLAMCPTI